MNKKFESKFLDSDTVASIRSIACDLYRLGTEGRTPEQIRESLFMQILINTAVGALSDPAEQKAIAAAAEKYIDAVLET